MGIIKSGILGGFKNKVGPVVGSSWKGISVMRGMPESVANPNTVAQQVQRTKFSRVSKFASQLLTSVIKPYWDADAKKMSGYNAFVQRNIDAFAVENEPAMENIIMARGRLAITPIHPNTAIITGNFQIVWSEELVAVGYSKDDRAVIVLTDSLGNIVAQSIEEKTRFDAEFELPIPSRFSSETEFYCFLFFVGADGKQISDSQVKLLTVK